MRCWGGGAEGSWTPVRKPVLTTFSGCSLSFRSPSPERRQTGFQVWQPLIHHLLQGYLLMTFTTSRRHIPARGTARYDGSALRQLLTQNCNLRLSLRLRRLKWFRPHYPLIMPQNPRRSLYGPIILFMIIIVYHIWTTLSSTPALFPEKFSSPSTNTLCNYQQFFIVSSPARRIL